MTFAYSIASLVRYDILGVVVKRFEDLVICHPQNRNVACFLFSLWKFLEQSQFLKFHNDILWYRFIFILCSGYLLRPFSLKAIILLFGRIFMNYIYDYFLCFLFLEYWQNFKFLYILSPIFHFISLFYSLKISSTLFSTLL